MTKNRYAVRLTDAMCRAALGSAWRPGRYLWLLPGEGRKYALDFSRAALFDDAAQVYAVGERIDTMDHAIVEIVEVT